MGILGKLLGGAPKVVEIMATHVHPDRDDAALSIVGESNYQPALMAVAGRLTTDGPTNRDHMAAIVMEPNNRYDPNAIAVHVGSQRVGYLTRDDAVAYRPVMKWLAARGKAMAADAYLTGGWDNGRGDKGSIGVVLHLGSPAETMLELTCSDRPVRTDHPWPGALITLTGDSQSRLEGVSINRKAVAWCAMKAGLTVSPRITKKVQLLVDLTGDGITGNAVKAREYGIPIINENVFWQALGVPVVGGAEPANAWKTRR